MTLPWKLQRKLQPRLPLRQRGVAVITALLLTTLAVTIVASLFWQQQVQVRTIENQRTQLQKQWILRGALDWARLILTENAKNSIGSDTLQQPWAVGLAETRLDSYVENGQSESQAGSATISGQIIDAQSYLNLRGLSQGGIPNPIDVAAFQKLLTLLSIEPALAEATAATMAAGQPKQLTPANPIAAAAAASAAAAGGTPSAATGVTGATTAPATGAAPPNAAADAGARVLGIRELDDLLAVPGFTPAILAKLRNFIVILPTPTSVNVNTASAEVLAARIASLSLPDAQALVTSRNSAPFRDINGFNNRFAGNPQTAAEPLVSVRTDYFIVDGRVKLNRAGLEVLALIQRSNKFPITSSVIWIRER